MARAMVLGSAGQDGQFLVDLLLRKGFEVLGLTKLKTNHENPLKLLRSEEKVCDITEYQKIKTIVDNFEPNYIYNLAAVSSVSQSFHNVEEVISSNSIGFLNILNIVKDLKRGGRKITVFQASSSEMFGSSDKPLDERSPMMPVSPYAI